MSNRKVIELLLQLKSAKAHGKNYIKVKPHLVRHLLHNCLLKLRETQQMITLKMAEQRRFDFCIVFTMSFCALELKQFLITLPFQII